jgi:hypothetical protein
MAQLSVRTGKVQQKGGNINVKTKERDNERQTKDYLGALRYR